MRIRFSGARSVSSLIYTLEAKTNLILYDQLCMYDCVLHTCICSITNFEYITTNLIYCLYKETQPEMQECVEESGTFKKIGYKREKEDMKQKIKNKMHRIVAVLFISFSNYA